MKKMMDILWLIYCYAVVGFITVLLICFFVFGGEFSVKINFHSWVDLIQTFRKSK